MQLLCLTAIFVISVVSVISEVSTWLSMVAYHFFTTRFWLKDGLDIERMILRITCLC